MIKQLRKLCIFCIYLSIYFCFIKKGSCQKQIVLSNNLLSYYENVNKAENEIIQNQLKSNLKSYKKAFKIYPQGFYTDHLNAFFVAEKLKDKESILEFAKFLIQHGICKEFFTRHVLPLDSLKFKEFYDQIRNVRVIDDSYRKLIDELKDMDQEVRINNSNDKERSQTDSLNYESFKLLVSKKSFPSVNNYGFKCNVYFGVDFTYTILLKHFNPRKYQGIIEILTTALEKGEIKNDEYIDLLSFNNGGKGLTKYSPHPIYIIDDKYYEDLQYSIVGNEIDANRKNIGLYSYKDFLLRLRYLINNPKSEFYFINPILSFKSKDVGDRIFKAVKPINMDMK